LRGNNLWCRVHSDSDNEPFSISCKKRGFA
jgi:hypothetical protein